MGCNKCCSIVTGPLYDSISQRTKSQTNDENVKNSSRGLEVYFRMKQLNAVLGTNAFFYSTSPRKS